MESITAFHEAVINHRPIPNYSWSVGKDGELLVKPGQHGRRGAPVAGDQPQGPRLPRRHHRQGRSSEKLAMRADGSYVANVPKPASGYTAYFVEITEPSGGRYPFKFTTEVYVKPDVLPLPLGDAKPITKPAD
jgi:hypothetical protein